MTIESFQPQFQIGEKERETVKWGWEHGRIEQWKNAYEASVIPPFQYSSIPALRIEILS